MTKKIVFFVALFCFASFSGKAAAGFDGYGATHKSASCQGIGNTPFAIGIGADFGVSTEAFNFGFPIELRLNSLDDRFTFRFGERISFHEGGDDSAVYDDPYFHSLMWQPTVGFTQFSTYAAIRWNFLEIDRHVVLFAGLGYYFNVNRRGRVYMDIPTVSYIHGNPVYDFGNGRDFKRFDFEDIVNQISHSARFELGLECSFMELSMFLSFDITKPYNIYNASQNVYYDINGIDDVIHYEQMPGNVEANFYSFRNIQYAMTDICYFGMSLKFFLFGGWD